MTSSISSVFDQNYKYGFQTEIEKETFPKGISEQILALLSEEKKEPDFLKTFRLKAFQKWKKLSFPSWANLEIPPVDFQDITYYSVPKQKKKTSKFRGSRSKIVRNL